MKRPIARDQRGTPVMLSQIQEMKGRIKQVTDVEVTAREAMELIWFVRESDRQAALAEYKQAKEA